MNEKTKKRDFSFNIRKFRWLPIFIFIILSLMFFLFINKIQKDIDIKAQQHFQDEIDLVEQAILTRADIYINVLRSGVGLFDSSEFVSREEWKIFTESIDLQNNFPGIQGIGYAQVVPAQEKKFFVETIRNQGFPEFNIYPDAVRPEYTAIIYLEPFDLRNQKAFGYDMFSESMRHEAMSLARDTGNPQMSGRVTLVQEIDEDVQAGFLIYLPLYDKNRSLTSEEERKEALRGYVYSPFRAGNFFNGLFSDRNLLLDFAVFDQRRDDFDQSALIYTSLPKKQSFDKRFFEKSNFSVKRNIRVANHDWTIFFTANSDFINEFSTPYSPNFLLGIGLFISSLISWIVYISINYQNKAIYIAKNMTKDLQDKVIDLEENNKKLEKSNEYLDAQNKKLSIKLEKLNKVNKYLVDRELTVMNLEQEINDLEKKKNV